MYNINVKSNITKILNIDENAEQKFGFKLQNENMKKLQHTLSNELTTTVQAFSWGEKDWNKPCLVASESSLLYDSRKQIHCIKNNMYTKETDKKFKGKNVKNKNTAVYIGLLSESL